MNAVDVLIVILLVSALSFGFARGFWLTFFEYVGVLGGFVIGAALAPLAISRLSTEAIQLRLIVALLFLCGGAAIGSSIAHLAGEPLRQLAHRLRLVGLFDSVAG